MQGKMLAARAHEGQSELKVEEVDIPTIGDDDVLVKVHALGITRGLIALWRWTNLIKLLPAPLGYEIAGTVAEVGKNVRHVQVGARVRVHPVLSCGSCNDCTNDQQSFCPQVSVMGSAVYGEAGMPLYERYHNGGSAEYIKAPAANIDPLPDNVSFDVGARIHTLSMAYRTLRKASIVQGDAMILNAATGALGVATIKLAPLFGVSRIYAVSRSRQNLEKLQQLAPDFIEVIPTEELPEGWQDNEGLTQRLKQATGGGGAEVLLDWMPTGGPVAGPVVVQSILALRKGGRAVLGGGFYGPLQFPWERIMQNSWEIRGINGYARRDPREVIELLRRGRVTGLDDLVSHRFPLREINKAVEAVEQRADGARFVVVHP